MATQDDPPTRIDELSLRIFELPKWLVEPAVSSCRLFNTALDFIFYDVPTLRAALAEKDAPMQARGEKPPSRIIAFDALSDPEGSLLLIDATTAPYVHKYQSVEKFLESAYQESQNVDIATITGVGSSALGSAALAWNISVALKKPVTQQDTDPDWACDSCPGDRTHRPTACRIDPGCHARRADFPLRLGLIGRASCPAGTSLSTLPLTDRTQ
jgi:hypothetical protein